MTPNICVTQYSLQRFLMSIVTFNSHSKCEVQFTLPFYRFFKKTEPQWKRI